MTYLDRYKARVNAWGSNEVEQFQNFGKYNFEEFLAATPNKVYIQYQFTDIVGAIYSGSRKDYTENVNYLLTRLDEPVPIGLVYTDSYSKDWIVVVQDNLNPPAYNRYSTLECNRVVKWQDNYGVEQATSCYLVSTLDTKLQAIFDNAKDLIIPLKNGQIKIIMPQLNIAKDQRFIINGRAWDTVGNDNISIEGLMFLTLEETLINSQTDDIQNKIADKSKDIWSIQVKTPTFKRLVGETAVADYVVYHNGLIVNEPVMIAANNDLVTIAGNTITAEALGTSTITISLKNEPTIRTQLTVEIVSTIDVEQINYKITGNDFIKWGQSAEYYAYQFINGAQQATACTFEVSDVKLVTSTVEGNKITLKATDNNATGTVILKAKFDNDNIVEKTIRIVSLWS